MQARRAVKDPRVHGLWGKTWFVLLREEDAEQRSILITFEFIRKGCRKQITVTDKLLTATKRLRTL